MTPVDELAPGGQCRPADALQAPVHILAFADEPLLLPNRPLTHGAHARDSETVPAGHKAPLTDVEPATQPEPEDTLHVPEQVADVAPDELPKNPSEQSKHDTDGTPAGEYRPAGQMS